MAHTELTEAQVQERFPAAWAAHQAACQEDEPDCELTFLWFEEDGVLIVCSHDVYAWWGQWTGTAFEERHCPDWYVPEKVYG